MAEEAEAHRLKVEAEAESHRLQLAHDAKVAAEKRIEYAARKVLGRMKMLAVGQAFASWLDLLEQKRLQEVARRVLGRFMWQSAGRAFARWEEMVSTKKHREQVLRKTVARLMHMAAGHCFHRWAGVVRAGRDCKREEQMSAWFESQQAEVSRTLVEQSTETLTKLGLHVRFAFLLLSSLFLSCSITQ